MMLDILGRATLFVILLRTRGSQVGARFRGLINLAHSQQSKGSGSKVVMMVLLHVGIMDLYVYKWAVSTEIVVPLPT